MGRAKAFYVEKVGLRALEADNGHTYNGNAGQMSLGASYGDKTTAYQFAVDVQGFSFGIDIVAVLKGSEVMEFEYADLGTPDLQTVNSLVGMAASKLL